MSKPDRPLTVAEALELLEILERTFSWVPSFTGTPSYNSFTGLAQAYRDKLNKGPK